MTHGEIVSKFRTVLVWNDVPIAAYEQQRWGEQHFNLLVSEIRSGDSGDADLVDDVGGIELELREYTRFDEYTVIRSVLLRPHSPDEGRDPDPDPVQPTPPLPTSVAPRLTHVTLTVKPGQTLEQAERAEHRGSPSLRVLQGLVEGYIETVPHLTSLELDGRRVRCTVYVNEEGRLVGMPRNDAMSSLWKRELLRRQPGAEFRYEPELFGPVAIVFKKQAEKAR